MCGLKLGTEAVKKLGKKKTVKLCVRGMLTKSSSCCHAICICCSIAKLELCLGLQKKSSLLCSQWQAQSLGWGSRTLMDWFHRENAAWCPLRFKRRKNLLKTCPQIKHNKAQEWSLGSSLVSAFHISYACMRTLVLLAAVLGPSCACTTAEMRVSSSDLLLSPELLPLLVLSSYFCASFGGGCHLVSLTPSAGEGAAGRCAVRQSRCGILSTLSLSCINDIGNPSLLGHVCGCLSK